MALMFIMLLIRRVDCLNHHAVAIHLQRFDISLPLIPQVCLFASKLLRGIVLLLLYVLLARAPTILSSALDTHRSGVTLKEIST